MKRPYRVLLNLCSLALLLFALYLNFVKKESTDVFVPQAGQSTHSPATSSLKKGDLKLLPSRPSDGTLVLK